MKLNINFELSLKGELQLNIWLLKMTLTWHQLHFNGVNRSIAVELHVQTLICFQLWTFDMSIRYI